jgi:myo-inositol-1(or 4)-monophosphatase
MSMITWPVPMPDLPDGVFGPLADAAHACSAAYGAARSRHPRRELTEVVGMGADGTPTMRVDALVEAAIVESVSRNRVNLLSEEAGFIDHGSSVTLVIDPVDGSANAAMGVPLSCFAGAVFRDGIATEALTVWLDTGRAWWALSGTQTRYRTTGRTTVDGSAVAMLRPKDNSMDAWLRVANRVDRVRVLSTTCLEAALVAEGSMDAFIDPGSDTHRIMDLAAAMVTLPAAGGVVVDVHGRPLKFELDLSRRWSGIAAASMPLAEQLAAIVTGAG